MIEKQARSKRTRFLQSKTRRIRNQQNGNPMKYKPAKMYRVERRNVAFSYRSGTQDHPSLRLQHSNQSSESEHRTKLHLRIGDRACRRRGGRWQSRWSRRSWQARRSAWSSIRGRRPCRTSACFHRRLSRRRSRWSRWHRTRRWLYGGAYRPSQPRSRAEPRRRVWRSRRTRTGTEMSLSPLLRSE